MSIYQKILVLFFLFTSCVHTKHKNEKFTLQVGDILFQDLDSSPLCDAIELVTPGFNNGNFSHIGIVVEVGDLHCINPNYNYNDDVKILEAIPNKVKKTRLDSFLNRSFDKNNNPKVIVGRLKPKYQYTIPNAITFLKSKIGTKYDDEFLMNNETYYCSELIYDAFKNDSIFSLNPMTFINPSTNDTLEAWIDYYRKLNIQIPENQLGINPGLMSISNKINIIHVYGYPDEYIVE